jgi:hypothetical protein
MKTHPPIYQQAKINKMYKRCIWHGFASRIATFNKQEKLVVRGILTNK